MKKIGFIITALFLIIVTNKKASAQVSQQEFDALVAFYNATNGDNWTNNTGWNINAQSEEVASSWYGLTVSGGHVTHIELEENNLTGNIPEELGNLSGLVRFYAYSNHLSGSIPSEIGLLSNLEYLRIEDNQLTGQIPTEIGMLSNLKVLHLSNNDLNGPIPEEFYTLTNLTGVQLFNNNFTGTLSPLIGDITGLRSLYLYGNQLTGSIPPEIGNLTVLLSLYLNGNQFSGTIPAEIGNLSLLKSLSLQQNELTGPIPASIGNLSNLALFKVGNNQLTRDIPESVFGLSKLTNFQLNDNNFTGKISTNITNLVNLEYLYLNGNRFEGDFPALNGCDKLITVRLNDNHFENLPDFLGLANLSTLNAENNHLTFEDLEPNITIPNITYNPQRKVGEEINYNVIKGGSYTMSVNAGGTANTYQWYKDGAEIIDATSESYAIDNFIETDVAVYHCEIRSGIISDLILVSNDISLGITVGLITIDASGNTESNTCTISGVISTTDFQTTIAYSFAPETIPGTAQLEINSEANASKRIQFNIDNNYNISNVQIEVEGNYVPLYNGFYLITKVEENLHSTLLLNSIEEICIYYPD